MVSQDSFSTLIPAVPPATTSVMLLLGYPIYQWFILLMIGYTILMMYVLIRDKIWGAKARREKLKNKIDQAYRDYVNTLSGHYIDAAELPFEATDDEDKVA